MTLFQEELQESKDQYNDLERNLQQVNSLEKNLLDKDNLVSSQSASFILVMWHKPAYQRAVF